MCVPASIRLKRARRAGPIGPRASGPSHVIGRYYYYYYCPSWRRSTATHKRHTPPAIIITSNTMSTAAYAPAWRENSGGGGGIGTIGGGDTGGSSTRDGWGHSPRRTRDQQTKNTEQPALYVDDDHTRHRTQIIHSGGRRTHHARHGGTQWVVGNTASVRNRRSRKKKYHTAYVLYTHTPRSSSGTRAARYYRSAPAAQPINAVAILCSVRTRT